MPQRSDELARDLRSSVLAGDHAEVLRLSAAYTEALRQEWNKLSAAERANSTLPEQSLELLGWVREMTIVQQGLAAQHLSILEEAGRYQSARARYLLSALDAED